MLHYNLSAFSDVYEFLAILARKIGRLKRGGEPDLNAAAKFVLYDWNSYAFWFPMHFCEYTSLLGFLVRFDILFDHLHSSGKIRFYVTPPELHPSVAQGETRVISQLGSEFNLDQVYSRDSNLLTGFILVDFIKHPLLLEFRLKLFSSAISHFSSP